MWQDLCIVFLLVIQFLAAEVAYLLLMIFKFIELVKLKPTNTQDTPGVLESKDA